MCGEDFDKLDETEKFRIHHKVGYGSIHDGDEIDLDLCCRCFDELLDCIIPKCTVNPMKGGYIYKNN